jgi:hypothetical protein
MFRRFFLFAPTRVRTMGKNDGLELGRFRATLRL